MAHLRTPAINTTTNLLGLRKTLNARNLIKPRRNNNSEINYNEYFGLICYDTVSNATDLFDLHKKVDSGREM